jgi:hypothetical protein
VPHCVVSKDLQDSLLRGVYASWDDVEIEDVRRGLGQFDTGETGDSHTVEGFVDVLVWCGSGWYLETPIVWRFCRMELVACVPQC